MASWITIKKYLRPIFVLTLRVAGIVAVFKICSSYDWKNIGQILSLKSLPVIIGALALYFMKHLVDAFRSKRMAMTLDIFVPFGKLLKFNIQSIAFDFAIPVPQAEEFYRFGRIASYTDKKTAGALAVSLRLTGLFATLCTLAATIVFGS